MTTQARSSVHYFVGYDKHMCSCLGIATCLTFLSVLCILYAKHSSDAFSYVSNSIVKLHRNRHWSLYCCKYYVCNCSVVQEKSAELAYS